MPALPHLASALDAHHRYHERRQRCAATDLYWWIDAVSRFGPDHEHGWPAPARLSAWLERGATQTGSVLRGVPESAAQFASGLCDGAPLVAAGSRSDAGNLRVVFSSGGNGQAGIRRRRCAGVLGQDKSRGLADLGVITAGNQLPGLHAWTLFAPRRLANGV